MDHQDIDTRVEQLVDGERSPASLRVAIGKVVERIRELEAEGCALAEVRDVEEMRRGDVEGRLREAERALSRMRATVDASNRRAGELELEIEAAEAEIVALEQRDRAAAQRLQALVSEAEEMARDQRVRRDAAAAIGIALDGVRDTIQRIGQKIEFADRKYGPARKVSASGGKQ